MKKATSKTDKSRTTVTAQDDAGAIALLHHAWRRDMAKALGAVETQNAAVDKMDAVRKVNALLNGDK